MIRRILLVSILLAGCSSKDTGHGTLYSAAQDQVCVFLPDGGFGIEPVGIPVTVVDLTPDKLGNVRVMIHAGRYKDQMARVSKSDIKPD